MKLIISKKKQKSQCLMSMKSFASRHKGKKSYLEDRIMQFPDLTLFEPSLLGGKYALFGLFDGHSGYFVASLLINLFPKYLLEEFRKNIPHEILNLKEKDEFIKKAIIHTFVNCDKKILSLQKKQDRYDGSTGCICLIENTSLWTANIGDTKSILCINKNNDVKSIILTKDHTAQQKAEQKRINLNGGYVEMNRVLGILQISRSFGDPDFKKVGVTAIPYISKVSLNSKINFILLATDGLWNKWKISEVSSLIYKILKNPTKPTLKEIAGIIIEETILHRNCADNCSVLLVKFDEF